MTNQVDILMESTSESKESKGFLRRVFDVVVVGAACLGLMGLLTVIGMGILNAVSNSEGLLFLGIFTTFFLMIMMGIFVSQFLKTFFSRL